MMLHPLPLLISSLLPAFDEPSSGGWTEFVGAAAELGDVAHRGARFLAEHRPAFDDDVASELLVENLRYALRAREEFPWCRDLDEERFFNDVLPYAVLDETRERWRPKLFAMAKEIVQGCESATEAAEALNRELFDRIEVHYNTGRKKPNQSPSESIAQGRATCTGLSILLVDACRAVGVPARVAGTALWSNKRGNHTWVEVWDGRWMFTGADEYDEKGLDRGWFVGDASKAQADDWRHAIWATSWKKTGDSFPMVWNLDCRDVPAVNVTDRYTGGAKSSKPETGVVYLRVLDRPGGSRLAVDVDVIDAAGEVVATVTTRAGQADRNDMPHVRVAPRQDYLLRVRMEDEERIFPLRVDEAGEVTRDLAWSESTDSTAAERLVDRWLALLPEERHLSIPSVPLSKEDSAHVTERVWQVHADELIREREREHTEKEIALGDVTLRYDTRVFGDREEGRSLWISLHGGGGAPTRVNDRQWKNQVGLYEPAEGIYVAPRAPTDSWNMWHRGHVDDLFDRLIENHVLLDGVDPDRVYLLGYSAGGDGVYQLAPRMADRFAAAAMMAGHPNEASPLGLRNLPFALYMGGADDAYKRSQVAATWGRRLAELREQDGDGYLHRVRIYEGVGHWMNKRDAEALPWMAEHTRDPWPPKVVWRQDDRTHRRFYWLAMPADQDLAAGQRVTAQVEGQRITIDADGVRSVTLRLSDRLLDLDRPVVVEVGGDVVFDGVVPRTVSAIHRSLMERADPRSVATAELTVAW